MSIVEDLKEAGSVSALARSAGVHRETIQARLREAGGDPGKPIKGRHAKLAITMPVSGVRFHYADPRPEMVHFGDVAHCLSRICRFNGGVDGYLSVAEHAVNVARRVLLRTGNPGFAVCALHHDSHEAYIGDIVSPLKAFLGPAVKRLEARVDAAIVAKFNLSRWWADAKPSVREADEYFVHQEGLYFRAEGHRWGEPSMRLWVPDDVVLGEDFLGLPPGEAEALFSTTNFNLWAMLVP